MSLLETIRTEREKLDVSIANQRDALRQIEAEIIRQVGEDKGREVIAAMEEMALMLEGERPFDMNRVSEIQRMLSELKPLESPPPH